jgi:hypothetical protein
LIFQNLFVSFTEVDNVIRDGSSTGLSMALAIAPAATA